MKRIGLMFPGQGSQHIGMGHELYKRYPMARDVFDQVDSILQCHLSQLIFHGDENELRKTSNAQPAILAHSLATLAVLQSESNVFHEPSIVMGHSLGEFTAACAAGYLELDEAVQMVRARGKAMEAAAAQAGETSMVAMLPLSYEKSMALCEEIQAVQPNHVCQVANWNATNQVVLSGHKAAVEQAVQLGKEKFKVRRAIPLDVSAPFHCSLLQSVEQEVEHLLQASTGSKRRKSNATTKEEKKNAPSTTHMITNINGTLQHDWTSICSDLSKQTCETVKWVRCMDTAIEGTDVETWYEVGPGVALSNLMKRHMPKHYHCSNAIELIQAL